MDKSKKQKPKIADLGFLTQSGPDATLPEDLNTMCALDSRINSVL